MEFAEFLAISVTLVTVFVLFPSVVINGIVRLKKAKAERGAEALHLSELQLVIEAAVEEATAPLHARIARLEAERGLPAHEEEPHRALGSARQIA